MTTPKNQAAVCHPSKDAPPARKHLPRGVCRFCGRKALAPNSRICADGAESLAKELKK